MLSWLNRSQLPPTNDPDTTPVSTSHSADQTPAVDLTQISIPGYRVLRELGKGATSTVYLARRCQPDRLLSLAASTAELVAIKVSDGEAAEPLVGARFRREAEVVSRLSTAYAIKIFDSGQTVNRQLYHVMEYVPGKDMATLCQIHGPLPDGRVLAILRQLCEVVGEIHRQGLLHRDIKPSNIMLFQTNAQGSSQPEAVKLLDFGLSTNADISLEATPATATHVSGTPHYSAPEVWQSPSSLDPRSDIYSLGCCAYHWLTGRTVFPATNPLDVCSKHIRENPTNLAKLNLPVAQPLAELVMDCLSKVPSTRPQSAQEFAAALDKIAPCTPWTNEDAGHWWVKHPHHSA